MHIIAIVNQKGGVAKTSTALALSSGLTGRGKKVLAIDLDPQCNLSYAAGADLTKITIKDVLTKMAKGTDAIQTTPQGDIIPSDDLLSGADNYINGTGQEFRLKEALATIKDNYDYIILDCPPALGVLTVNALTACSHVIIPAQAEVFSMQGISQLKNTIDAVKSYTNPQLEIAGILLTRHNARSILTRDVADMITEQANYMGTKVFETKIREAVVLRESQINQESLFTYSPKSNVTLDYNTFIDELLGGINHE
ncbi:MAG: ParA family protein [Nitrososphaerota archaeon]|jgi:chromosome partitioning protein|nr:ParA family protein [Nitrososphaerota archaeon]